MADFIIRFAGAGGSIVDELGGRQVVVLLSGELEVGTTDGQTRRWRAGELFLASDVTGKGHTTRTVGGPARVMFAPLPDSFNIDRWSA